MTARLSPAINAHRFLVSGRVQGVFYRGSTRAEALRLGLTGYARNLPDGRVEVLAVGDATAIKVLAKWLWRGPPVAEVQAVEGVAVTLAEGDSMPTGFITL
jgi:acylphosphatase